MKEYQRCTRCVMDNASDPTISFDAVGHCNYCTDVLRRMPAEYFPNEEGKRRLDAMVAEIKETCKEAALLAGASVDFKTETLCLAYRVDPSSRVVSRFTKACDSLHLEPNLISTYGGSDNNHFFHHGITGLVVACGMNDCHSCKEYTSVPDLMKAARLAEALILAE